MAVSDRRGKNAGRRSYDNIVDVDFGRAHRDEVSKMLMHFYEQSLVENFQGSGLILLKPGLRYVTAISGAGKDRPDLLLAPLSQLEFDLNIRRK